MSREIPEIKEALDELGIEYEEQDGYKVYVTADNGMYIRITDDPDYPCSYYIRHTGMIYEAVSFDEAIDMIKELVGYADDMR